MTVERLLELSKDLPRKARVILTNLLTVLIAVQTLVTVIITEVENDQVTRYGVIALTGIGSAIIFIRRVTPVDKSERGI